MVFEELELGIGYEANIKYSSRSTDVIVIFAHSERHALIKYPYQHNVIFVRDKKAKYYLSRAGMASLGLQKAIHELGFRKSIYVGTSKGGFGAILWAGLAARRTKDRKFNVLAFSPQTRLWPRNEFLYFPSYHRMIDADAIKEFSPLRKYGNLDFVRNRSNLAITLVYGRDNAVDKAEAMALRGLNINHLPVPFGYHGSLVPFTIERKDDQALRGLVERMYSKAAEDEDLAATLPRNPEEMFISLQEFASGSDLNDLLDDCLAKQPNMMAMLLSKATRSLGLR